MSDTRTILLDLSAPPRQARHRPWTWIAVGILGGATLGGAGLWWRWHAPAVAPAPAAAQRATSLNPQSKDDLDYVEVAAARLAPALKPLPLPGRITFDPTRTTRLMAPIGGQIDTVLVHVGDNVAAGQRLMSLRSSGMVSLLTEEKLAQTAVAAETRTLARVQALVALRAAPQRDLIAAQHALRDAQLAHEAALLKRRSLRVATSDRGLYWLEAPRAGVIAERNAAVGQLAGPEHTEPLVVIADLDEVVAIANVPESEVADLKAGHAAQVTTSAAPDHPVSGHIDWVSQLVDPERHTVDVRIRLGNEDGSLRPNAWVLVTFEASEGERVVLPSTAVVRDDQSTAVFVRKSAGQMERRAVVMGRQREGRVEILSGLEPGEPVVVRGAVLLLNALATEPMPHG